MKYLYIITALFLMISCNDKEKQLLLKTQTDYIEDLVNNEKGLIQYIEKKYCTDGLLIDTIQPLKEYKSSFDNLMNKYSKENILKYNKDKIELSKIYKNINRLTNYPKDTLVITTLKNKVDSNEFTINLLQIHLKFLKYFANGMTRMSSCSHSERVKIHLDLYDIKTKDSYLRNGKLYFNIDGYLLGFYKIYFGKLDTSFYNEKSLLVNNEVYSIDNETELRMKVFEKFNSEFLVKDLTFKLSKLNKKYYYDNVIEGMISVPSLRGGYDVYPFRFLFEE